MKIKSFLSVIGACALLVSMAGCSKDKFDAAAYTTALLDAEYKGNTEEYAKLSGLDAAELTSRYEEHITELVTASVGETTSVPGSEAIPPQTLQDYTDLWKNILSKTSYEVTETKKTDDNYTVTVETRQMNLYSRMGEILTGKLEALYAEAPESSDGDVTDPYILLALEAYQEALDGMTYQEPVTVDVTLVKSEQPSWNISDEDLELLASKLIDTAVAENKPEDSLTQIPPTEATPNVVAPEDLNAASFQIGESYSLQKDEVDVAEISIDHVESTEERSEFDPTNPEKVVVITYTYKNLRMEDPLLYDEMSFQVMEGDTVCTPYYLQSLIPPDAAYKDGDAVTASIAYGVSSSCKEVTIYVNGVQIDDPFVVTASIS